MLTLFFFEGTNEIWQNGHDRAGVSTVTPVPEAQYQIVVDPL